MILVTLWDDSDWSGLPTENPGSGKPWLHSSGVICVGGYTPPDLSTKADLVAGKVPSSQLPSYVDDVLEYSSTAAFPGTGETGKIYVALDTNRTYRWSGSAYIELTDQTAVWGSISGTLASQTDLSTALAAKAADSAVVHTTGNETIGGNKALTGTLSAPSLTITNADSSNVGAVVQPWIQLKNNSGTSCGYVGAGTSLFTSVANGSTDGGIRTVGKFGVSTGNSVTPCFSIDTVGAAVFTLVSGSTPAVTVRQDGYETGSPLIEFQRNTNATGIMRLGGIYMNYNGDLVFGVDDGSTNQFAGKSFRVAVGSGKSFGVGRSANSLTPPFTVSDVGAVSASAGTFSGAVSASNFIASGTVTGINGFLLNNGFSVYSNGMLYRDSGGPVYLRGAAAGNNFLAPGGDLNLEGGDVGGYQGTYVHGGNVKIRGGNAASTNSNAGNGGTVYVYGGAKVNSGSDGNVILAHTGSAARGRVLVATATDDGASQLQVTGTALINGTLQSTNWSGDILKLIGHSNSTFSIQQDTSWTYMKCGSKGVSFDNLTTMSLGGALTIASAFKYGPKTFGTLPSASANQGARFRLTDRGEKVVYSDGTDWRFDNDNSIAS